MPGYLRAEAVLRPTNVAPSFWFGNTEKNGVSREWTGWMLSEVAGVGRVLDLGLHNMQLLHGQSKKSV